MSINSSNYQIEQSLKSSAIYIQQKIYKDQELIHQHDNQQSQQFQTQNYNQHQDNQTYNQDLSEQHFQEQSSLPLCLQINNEFQQPIQSQTISQISQYLINKKMENKQSNLKQDTLRNKQVIKFTQQQKIKNKNKQQNKVCKKMPSSELPAQLYLQRNHMLSLQLQQQRVKNLHLQKIIQILRQQSTLSQRKFTQISQHYWLKISNYNELDQENCQLKRLNEQLELENKHYKELIYMANRNYEELDKKYIEVKQKMLEYQKQREQREYQYHQKMDELKKAIKQMIKNFKTQSNPMQNCSINFSTTRKSNQKGYINIMSINDKENCFSFGENQRREWLLNDSKQKKVNNINSKRQITKNGLKQVKINTNNDNLTKIQKDNVFNSVKFTSSQLNHINNSKQVSLNSTLNLIKNPIISIKSPKNTNVEQNYRKIFMKTLTLGKQTLNNV